MVLDRADSVGCMGDVRARAFEHANAALMLDGKNIHAWSHRAWLVERCDAWEDEMAFTEKMLKDDWMNNSAWNARFQCVAVSVERGDVNALEREATFATTSLGGDDDNESAWNYLRGLCAIAERDERGGAARRRGSRRRARGRRRARRRGFRAVAARRASPRRPRRRGSGSRRRYRSRRERGVDL